MMRIEAGIGSRVGLREGRAWDVHTASKRQSQGRQPGRADLSPRRVVQSPRAQLSIRVKIKNATTLWFWCLLSCTRQISDVFISFTQPHRRWLWPLQRQGSGEESEPPPDPWSPSARLGPYRCRNRTAPFPIPALSTPGKSSLRLPPWVQRPHSFICSHGTRFLLLPPARGFSRGHTICLLCFCLWNVSQRSD